MLLDTQADVSIIKRSSLSAQIHCDKQQIIKITGVTKGEIYSLGLIRPEIQIQNCIINQYLHVVPDTFEIPVDGILGKDFIKDNKCILDYGLQMLTIPGLNQILHIPIKQTPVCANNFIRQIKYTDSNVKRIDHLLRILTPNFPLHIASELTILCTEYADIFHLETDKLTTNNFYEQEIQLLDHTPVYIKNYRLPYTQYEEINTQIDKLIENDLIEPSRSNYNSPLLVVPKKSTDGTPKYRMCVDYKVLNKKIVADKYPIPRMDTIFDSLGDAKYFSVLDLTSGFHQIPLHENSRNITSFSCEKGSFRWKVLPFGLNISPNSFVRMMSMAFSGTNPSQSFIYMDDVIVIGKSEKDHLQKLRKTFDTFRKFNLKLNPEKAQFFRPEVTFLGHKCTNMGIRPDKAKDQVIKNYPKPMSKDETRRFVAFANFYRKFIRDFAALSRPLNQITRKNTNFDWNSIHDEAFTTIKNRLLRPPILAYPNFHKQFIVTVDASNYAMGAVLSQVTNGSEMPISFASKTFTKGETNKSTIEKELMAIHWAIKTFRPFLYGTKFLVKTDHRPLVYLFNLKDPSSKLTRLRIDLEEYSFEIQHIKGESNVVADAISRIDFEAIKNKSIKIMTRSMTKDIQARKANDSNQKNDEVVSKPKIYEAINVKEGHNSPILQMSYNKVNNELQIQVIRKNITTIQFKITNKVALPQLVQNALLRLERVASDSKIKQVQLSVSDDIFDSMQINEFKNLANQSLRKLMIVLKRLPAHVADSAHRQQLIERYHNDPLAGGHSGKARTLAKLQNYYTWKHMTRDVATYVKNCDACQRNKPKSKTREPLHLTSIPTKPFDTIVVDTIGPFPRSNSNNQYAITIICNLTKYLVCIPIENKESSTIARNIFEKFILTYGPMRQIITDMGTEYKNQTTAELFKLLKIKHNTSTAHHHETVGVVERSHRTLNEYLRTYLSQPRHDWDEHLLYFTFSYNITPNVSLNLKYSPYELLYGKQPIRWDEILTGNIDPIYNFDNFAKEAKFRLQQSHLWAQDLLKSSKEHNKINYDKHLNQINVKIGDKVLLEQPARHKLDPIYKGPFNIKEIKDLNVTIEDPDSNKEQIVHKNRLIKYIHFIKTADRQ